MLRVIDVSEHNGVIDWAKVKPNIDGAIIRCGYGSDMTSQDDSQFARNVAECKRLGIPYGFYLYSYADSADKIESEIKHILRLASGHHPVFPLYYDLEEWRCKNVWGLAANKWHEKISAAGYIDGVYTWARVANAYVHESSSYWMAAYGPDYNGQKYDSYKPVLTNGKILAAWQYTSTGRVPGIAHNVDVSEFYTDYVGATQQAKQVQRFDVIRPTDNGAVFRVYNVGTGEHLFTADGNEVETLTKAGGWKYEGVAWRYKNGGAAVHRLFNPQSGKHHYTASRAEISVLIAEYGWRDEGTKWCSVDGGKPVYRLYQPETGEHHYTMDTNEKSTLIRSGKWVDEGTAFYAL